MYFPCLSSVAQFEGRFITIKQEVGFPHTGDDNAQRRREIGEEGASVVQRNGRPGFDVRDQLSESSPVPGEFCWAGERIHTYVSTFGCRA